MTNEVTAEVRRRADNRCEYCHLPQDAFTRPFHIEHIIARQHGGQTQLENLALACWYCNLKKGPNLTGIDPQFGVVVSLFNPRMHHWNAHFGVRVAAGNPPGLEIEGLTPTGRATIRVLAMNEPMRCILRYELWGEGRFFL